MSEYELVDAFQSHVGLLLTFFMSFVSITSAFIVVGYLVGPKLSPLLTKLSVGVYVVGAFFLILSIQRITTIMVDLRAQMREVLSWHPAVYEPQWLIPAGIYLLAIAMLLLALGSVWYFFSARKDQA